MKKAIVGILVLAIVAWGSYNFGHKAGLAEFDIGKGEEKAKEDLIALTRSDFEEYQKLKTLEERYQKADEILGKVVTIFLADLGIRLGYKPIGIGELGNSCPPAPVAQCPTPPPQHVANTAPETPKPSPKQNLTWLREELRLVNENNAEDALRDLKKMIIPDFFSAVQSAQSMTTQDALAIEGKFAGEINFINRKDNKSDWLIEWEVHLRSPTSMTGPMLITLTNKSNGKVFSRTKGNTPGKDFMKIPGSRGLLVNVYGDDGYIQIYPFENKNTWLGNYYGKVKLGTYQMTGQVRLNRVQ